MTLPSSKPLALVPALSLAAGGFDEEEATIFRERVLRSMSISESGCWDWQLRRDKDGYGRMGRNRRRYGGSRSTEMAHRVAYELFVAPIPTGLEIDHLCRNRACVNPAHLEPVTHAENMRRGAGIGAPKTHCIHGHPFDEENTVWRKDGRGRDCAACRRLRRQGPIAGGSEEAGEQLSLGAVA